MRALAAAGRITLALAILAVVLTPCPAQDIETATYQFVASEGYYNGKSVYCLITDASNSSYANLLNANCSPLLANAFNNPYLPILYYVSNFRQGLIFSAEWPANLTPGSYSPVWQLYKVTWRYGASPVVLKSVAQIKAAARAGRLSVTTARAVVTASIVINSAGTCIKQGSYYSVGNLRIVTLPAPRVYVDGVAYEFLQLDFSNRGEATARGGTYAPLLSKFDIPRAQHKSASWQDIYCMWTVPAVGQLPIARQVPDPFGPGNLNPYYSPVMTEWSVNNPAPPVVYTSYSEIQGFPLSPTNYWAFQPIIRPVEISSVIGFGRPWRTVTVGQRNL